MEPIKKTFISPEEYLSIERKAEYKSEYFNGEMFGLAGARRNHILIVTNVVRELSTQLRKSGCEVYSNDMRVKVSETGLYTYPDIAVVCGKPLFEDKEADTLINPIVIIEILSESTEAYDRGKKFEHYRKISSLQEYVLISQDHYKIEKYIRQENLSNFTIRNSQEKNEKQNQPNGWFFFDESSLEKSVELLSIHCFLSLAEVYHKVVF